MVGNEERHYLIGIISTGIDLTKYCTASFTTLFTNIQFYQTFIKDIISESRTENLISLNNKIFENNNNNDCDITSIKSSIEEENVCGIIDENTESFLRPLIYGGNKTDITSAPWHVALYENTTSSFVYFCAGSIIHSNIVISAAHCFENTFKKKELFNYLVGTGKTYGSYDAIEKNSYYVTIKEIHIPKAFVVLTGINDVSILILDEHLKFSPYIRPVCIHFNNDNDYSIQDNLKGFATGWGVTSYDQDYYRAELVLAKFTTITNEKCKTIYVEAANEVTPDKFCALGENNAGGCKGDSGGGFIVKKNFGSGERYYLYGILTNALLKKGKSCSGEDISMFANVQFNKNFIKDLIAKNRIENKIYEKIFQKIKEILN